MVMISGKLRKWGNSFGVIIPKNVVKRERLKDGDLVEVLITHEDDTLVRMFGSLRGKFKKSTQEMLDQTDRELYGR